MKLTIVLITSILFTISTSLQRKNYDFRNVNWGMAKQDVKLHESSNDFTEDEHMLTYNKIVAGNYLATLVYDFNQDDSLYSATYLFDEEHTNPNLYINEFNTTKDLLIKEYGKPLSDETTWSNSLFKDKKENWGLALEMGYVKFETKWKTKNSTIGLELFGDNYKITSGIVYNSRKVLFPYQKEKINNGL